MNFLVFDTETTGLPGNFNVLAGPLNLDNWNSCRMVQIAWRIYSSEKELLDEQSYVIKPEGFTIPATATALHKITTKDALANGTNISDVLNILFKYIEQHEVECIVAHNINFDFNVVLSELYRANADCVVSIWRSLKKHCTMISNKSKFGGRWPKLHMLYSKLIGPMKDMNKLHGAAEDCRLCADIYLTYC